MPARFGHVDDDAVGSAELDLGVAALLAVPKQPARSRHHRGSQLLSTRLIDLLGEGIDILHPEADGMDAAPPGRLRTEV